MRDGYQADYDSRVHAEMARKGSRMLRDAILRAKGYPVQVIGKIAPAAPLKAPKFHKRPTRKGRPPQKRGPKPKVWSPSPKIEKINELVAAHFGITLRQFSTRSRRYERAHPRQIAMYLARKTTGISYPLIAKQLGYDHTTVLHAVNQVERRVAEQDAATIKALVAVHKVIGS